MAASRKAWGSLSRAYRRRMERAGLNARNWNTAEGAALRHKARGHAKTPEHPSEAARHPEKFREYVEKQSDEMRQLKARKEAVFGSAVRYKPSRAESNAEAAPTTGKTNRRLLRRFLRMPSDEAYLTVAAFATSISGKSREEALQIIATDWSGDDWSFLFYH